VGDYHLEPPPLFIVEVASPSTRAVDRGRKLRDYQLGGAGLYVLVDLPQPSGASEATFDVYDFRSSTTATGVGAIALIVHDTALRLDLR
jgi:Uma2 family endonuclease